tara:strand:- start:1291 stop:1395 length:105 start_codon:yes stop_codon:yes gene_type:complete
MEKKHDSKRRQLIKSVGLGAGAALLGNMVSAKEQ